MNFINIEKMDDLCDELRDKFPLERVLFEFEKNRILIYFRCSKEMSFHMLYLILKKHGLTENGIMYFLDDYKTWCLYFEDMKLTK